MKPSVEKGLASHSFITIGGGYPDTFANMMQFQKKWKKYVWDQMVPQSINYYHILEKCSMP